MNSILYLIGNQCNNNDNNDNDNDNDNGNDNGKTGRDFIDQITFHINEWNNCSDNQHIALKAAFTLLAVGLQKPSHNSKAKDHQDVLSKRLVLWRDGEIGKLLREGRIIQGRIGKRKRSDLPDRSKVFAKLVRGC